MTLERTLKIRWTELLKNPRRLKYYGTALAVTAVTFGTAVALQSSVRLWYGTIAAVVNGLSR